MNEQTITRVDLEQNGEHGVLVKEWYGTWAEESREDAFHYEAKATVFRLLSALEAQGFTCEMCDQLHGRALKGQITRIDFERKAGDQIVVKKFPYGWTAKTRPLQTTTCNLQAFGGDPVQWCKDHGWTVREWPGGARAFRGKELPVRDGSTIAHLRRQVQKHIASGQIDSRRAFDLAYDF
jgi:hypothetical protein